MPLRNATDDRDRNSFRDFLDARNKSICPIARMLSDHWHRVTGVSHLRENDQLRARLVFGAARKVADLKKIRFGITERTGNLGDGDFHLMYGIVMLSGAKHL